MTSGIKQVYGDFSYIIKCYCQCPCHQEIELHKHYFPDYERNGYPKFILGHNSSTLQSKKQHSERMKNRRVSIKTEFHKGRRPWNFGLTKETDERVRRGAEHISGEKHGMFGKIGAMKGRKKTEKQLKSFENVREKIKSNPELHPNRIMAKKGFISNPQKKLFELIQQIYSDAELEYPIKTLKRNRFADIGIPSLKLDFEMDGVYWHNSENDILRQKEIEEVGWKVIRFTDKEKLSTELINLKLSELNIIV